jgi:nicotinamidase-related amidase
MPEINQDLHGNVPDKAAVALLLIDMINDFQFPCGDQLLEHTWPVAHNIATLKRLAKQQGIPCIYVNDNFGKWQSDFSKLIEHCLEEDKPGRPLVEMLKPDEDDYFVLKPKHSGFFSTTLDLLLQYLHAHTLILTGVAGNICVLFTANDAYMRDFRLVVPSDCIASNTARENEYALEQMGEVLRAITTPLPELDLEALMSLGGEEETVPTETVVRKES